MTTMTHTKNPVAQAYERPATALQPPTVAGDQNAPAPVLALIIRDEVRIQHEVWVRKEQLRARYAAD